LITFFATQIQINNSLTSAMRLLQFLHAIMAVASRLTLFYLFHIKKFTEYAILNSFNWNNQVNVSVGSS